MPKADSGKRQIEEKLREIALAYPGAHEDFPWGERVVKVKGKVFVFLGKNEGDDSSFGLSVKLPHSNVMALSLPFAEPTGYGLGKSGWVSATFAAGDDVPVDMLREWLDESYRAVAPKRLLAQLDGGAKPAPAAAKTANPKTTKPKTAKASAAAKPAAAKPARTKAAAHPAPTKSSASPATKPARKRG